MGVHGEAVGGDSGPVRSGREHHSRRTNNPDLRGRYRDGGNNSWIMRAAEKKGECANNVR